MKLRQTGIILVCVLLVINICFGINLWLHIGKDRRAEERAAEEALQLSEAHGVSVECDVPSTDGLAAVTFARDDDAELAAAESLLGKTEQSNPGGGIVIYRSDSGEALFRSGGFMDIRIYAGNSGGMDEKTLISLAGIDEDEAVKSADGVYTQRKWDRVIFNTRLDVSSGSAASLTGRFITGSTYTVGEPAKSAAEVIVSLPSLFPDAKENIRISSIKEGFIASTARGGAKLTPVWLLETYPSGKIYVDLTLCSTVTPE